MSGWGWNSKFMARPDGTGLEWLKPFSEAVPWITLGVILFMNYLVSGVVTSAEGVAFDLPAHGTGERMGTRMVALMIPMPHETLVFFDDTRYVMGEPSAMASLGEQLRENIARTEKKELLVLADREVTGGHLMEFASIARESGVERVLFAERREGEGAEDAE